MGCQPKLIDFLWTQVKVEQINNTGAYSEACRGGGGEDQDFFQEVSGGGGSCISCKVGKSFISSLKYVYVFIQVYVPGIS